MTCVTVQTVIDVPFDALVVCVSRRFVVRVAVDATEDGVVRRIGMASAARDPNALYVRPGIDREISVIENRS